MVAETGVPSGLLSVKLVLFKVEGFISSEKVASTLASTATSGAPSAGDDIAYRGWCGIHAEAGVVGLLHTVYREKLSPRVQPRPIDV